MISTEILALSVSWRCPAGQIASSFLQAAAAAGDDMDMPMMPAFRRHRVGFSLKRRACVSDPLPSPQPSLSPTPAHHQATKLRGLLFATGHASCMVQIKPTYKYTLHSMACVPYETKQNKTKQQVLVIVRVSCWLLAMAAFCACSSDRLLGEGRRDQGRGRQRSI